MQSVLADPSLSSKAGRCKSSQKPRTLRSAVVKAVRTQNPSLTSAPTAPMRSARRAETGLAARPSVRVASAATLETTIEKPASGTKSPFKVLIAGAGIGGLVLGLALLKKGIQVQLFERDLTAIRGEGKYRGPIQVQSNALAALEAIDPDVASEIMAEGCITGDRINGLCDGITGEWYCKFDTFHPAVDRGLPVTRVISRVTLQEILYKHVVRLGGEDCVQEDCQVVSYEDDVTNSETGDKCIRMSLQDGRVFEGDILIGADGIWSKIRKQLIGETDANFSGYTCYTGIADFTPPDIEIVGYRVFLGNGQYFVSSDVGGGKVQWYGFHKEPAGGEDVPGCKKERLLRLFGNWTDHVTDLIRTTPEDDVLRRDIFDRAPIFTWTRGRVALLGDSAHAMQPNLGQGGCMAIEDGYQLGVELDNALRAAGGHLSKAQTEQVLSTYKGQRMMRAAAIHGLARMAALMTTTYKSYLGEGLGPLSWITKLKVPHPGKVAGYFAMQLTMPTVLSWVLGGNSQALEVSRRQQCLLADKPKHFTESDFERFMADDQALQRAARADWMLVSSCDEATQHASSSGRIIGHTLTTEPLTIGSGPSSAGYVCVKDIHVVPQHAQLWKEGEDYFVKDLGSEMGSWLNGTRIAPQQPVRLSPFDVLEFGRCPSHLPFKIKMQHVSLRSPPADSGTASDVAQRVLQPATA